MSTSSRALAFTVLLGTATLGCGRQSNDKPVAAASQPLAVGAAIPELAGVDQDGKTHHLQSNQGRPLLVYFYPKDGTPGCTKEACAFRDVWKRFEAAHVSLYGVSRDDRATHQKFAMEHRIPFPLIDDSDGKWASAFGVPDRGGKSARMSFVFNAAGQVAHVYPNVDPGVHAEEVLRDISAMKQ